MDTMTREQRSRCMRAVKGRDTLPEVIVRKWLYSQGYRFRCQYKRIPGRPDIAMPGLKTLIEIRGCFWHHHGWEWDGRRLVQARECREATTPKSNRAFWSAKFKANVIRDARHEQEWAELGWTAIIIWECALRTAGERERTFTKVGRWLAGIKAEIKAKERG